MITLHLHPFQRWILCDAYDQVACLSISQSHCIPQKKPTMFYGFTFFFFLNSNFHFDNLKLFGYSLCEDLRLVL